MTENVIKIVVISLVCLPIVLLVIALQWHTWRTKDNDLFHEEEFWISSKSRRAIQAIVILFAIVMRRDNEITASEALVAHEYFDKKFKSSRYMTVFRTDGNVLRSVLKKYLKGKLPTLRDCTSNILKAGVSYEVRLELLDYLFKTAYVSEGICDAEMVKLREIAQFLLIKEWDILSLEYKYEFRRRESSDRQKENQRLNKLSESIMRQAYLTLGVASDATDDEVRTAYREIVKVCHPDKLTEKAGSKEWEEKVVRFRHTVEAYHMVCDVRNIS